MALTPGFGDDESAVGCLAAQAHGSEAALARIVHQP